jgi:hypothetical protein
MGADVAARFGRPAGAVDCRLVFTVPEGDDARKVPSVCVVRVPPKRSDMQCSASASLFSLEENCSAL